MLKNIVPRERKTRTEYGIEFLYKDDPDAGFNFPCDERGELLPDIPPEALGNYLWCMGNPDKFSVFNEFRRYEWQYTEPGHGTCTCGEEVYLYDQYYGTCQCPKCGRWYNLFGQEMLAPEYWEDDPSDAEYW